MLRVPLIRHHLWRKRLFNSNTHSKMYQIVEQFTRENTQAKTYNETIDKLHSRDYYCD